ncbi:hypothetical protein Mapa_010478 [Marchantia paleacea]|nr:hypothetical protein Mapa_010478 [Marchantia paleacea]
MSYMASFSSKRKIMSEIVLFLVACLSISSAVSQSVPPPKLSTFASQYVVSWSTDHVRVAADGTVDLTLDQVSGSGYASKDMYTFGYVSTQIKLVGGNSAGTVTAYYLSSSMSSPYHDELDFEFLGNTTGQPYILQTNVFANGVGAREQRLNLWFDPTADFHTYSVLWNNQIIIFAVDQRPIRIFKNNVNLGVDYPRFKPMGIYSSLWNGEEWATRGGLDKIDWSGAPFIASYKAFNIDACINTNGAGNCANAVGWWSRAEYQSLDAASLNELNYVKRTYMIYDYCTDTERYPQAPPECATN